jgi:hypothetical protein
MGEPLRTLCHSIKRHTVPSSLNAQRPECLSPPAQIVWVPHPSRRWRRVGCKTPTQPQKAFALPLLLVVILHRTGSPANGLVRWVGRRRICCCVALFVCHSAAQRRSLLLYWPFCLSFRSAAEESAFCLQNLTNFQLLTTIFFKNSPEIACQAPKPTNPLSINNIHLAF